MLGREAAVPETAGQEARLEPVTLLHRQGPFRKHLAEVGDTESDALANNGRLLASTGTIMSSIPTTGQNAATIAAAVRLRPYDLERFRALDRARTPEEGIAALRDANVFAFPGPEQSFRHHIAFGELEASRDPQVDLGKPYHSRDVGEVAGPIVTKRYALTFDDGTSMPSDRYEKNAIGVMVEDVCGTGSRRHYYSVSDPKIAALMQAVNATFGARGIYQAAIGLPLEHNW